jgi:DNA-binding PadR family transcriptional regulator
MELSPTSRAILGMLGLGPMSGYEIKRFVDHSTRFFWAASYGQIYPELRRLSTAGLIEGTDDPTGGRQKTVYGLTAAGAEALRDWLAAPAEIQETRDESLLKIFFSDFAGPKATISSLEAKHDHHSDLAGRLRAIEGGAAKRPDSSPYLALRYGIAFNEFAAEWCEREAARLREDERKQPPQQRRGSANASQRAA